MRNPPQKFRKPADAAIFNFNFNGEVYCTDFITGETSFRFSARGVARSVILEAFADHQRLRVRMQRRASDWIAKLKLPAGWCFYRFEVDGKTQWDRAVGKMKTQDGRPCSLALIAAGAKTAVENSKSN